MRIPRIVEAMNYIDDDLVSWAVEYRTVPRNKLSWKYCVAAVACFCVFMTMLFIPRNLAVSPFKDTPPISNDNNVSTQSPQIKDPIENNIVINNAVSAPEIMLPFLGEDNLIAKSSQEMFEYYGLDITSQLASTGSFYEVNGHYSHGIYTFTDSVFDMNHFVYASEDGIQEIEFYIGKSTKIQDYVSGMSVDESEKSTVNKTDMYIYRYENSTETCLFSVLEINGCNLVVLTYSNQAQTFVSILESLIAK